MYSKHGSLEGAVLSVMWDFEEKGQYPCSVFDIYNYFNQERISKKAYTTLKTVMDRLYKKKILGRYKKGRSFCYKTLFSRSETIKKSLYEIAEKYTFGNIDTVVEIAGSIETSKEKCLARI